VIEVSGELSITRVGVAPELFCPAFGLDEHAASPPQMVAAAARPARLRRLSSLLMLSPSWMWIIDRVRPRVPRDAFTPRLLALR
jgi:hypothetical protein